MVRLSIKKLKTTLYYSLLAIGISLPASLGSAAAATGSAYFTLTPGSGIFNVGDFLTVKITENSGSVGVNFVQPKINYDKNVLAFQSVDASQTAFPWAGPIPTPNGVVDLPMGITGGVVKDTQTVAFVTFKITGAASSSSLTLANTSSIKSATPDATIPTGVLVNEEWNGVTTGATFTLKALPATPPTNPSGGGSGGGGSSSPGGKSPSTGSTSGTVKKPTVAGASSTAPTTVTTEPVQSTSEDSDAGALLVPTNHMVSIKIVDSNGKPIADAEVKLGNQTTHSLSNGNASFASVADGTYSISITHNGKTEKKSITVSGQGQPVSSVQNFKIKLAASAGLSKWITYTAIGLAILFILGFFIPRRRHKFKPYTSVDPNSITVSGQNNSQTAPVQPTQTVKPVAAVLPSQPTVLPGTYIQPTEPPSPGIGKGDNNINKDQQ